MRKTNRLVVFLLAVLMIASALPLSIGVFADDAEAAPTYTAPTREDIIAAVGAENVILDANIDVLTATSGGQNVSTDATAAVFGNNTGSTLNLVADNKGGYLVDDGNGGLAYQYGPATVTGKQIYVDIRQTKFGGSNKTDACVEIYDRRNQGFVVGVDLKGGDSYKAGNVVGICTRVACTNDTFSCVSVDAAGKLYAVGNTSTAIGQLSTEKFTRIEVYANVPQWKYFVYIDGVNMTPDGYNMPAKSKYAGHTFTVDGQNVTTVEGEYYFYGARFLQFSGAAADFTENSYIFDNYRAYYTDKATGVVGSYDPNAYVPASVAEIEAAVGAEKLLFATGFNGLDGAVSTSGANYALAADANATAYGWNTASKLHFVNKNGSYSVTNGALVIGKASVVEESYFDFRNFNDPGNGTKICAKAYDYRNTGFVIGGNFKAGDNFKAVTLFSPISRVNGGPDGLNLVAVNANGEIIPGVNGDGKVLGTLKQDKYTNIQVHVDIPNLKYYIYVDGMNMTPKGYKFMDASRYAGKAIDGMDATTQNGEYYLNAIRCFHIYKTACPTTLENEGSVLVVDDLRAYYTTPEVGVLGSTGVARDTVVEATPFGTLPNATIFGVTDTTFIKANKLSNWDVKLPTAVKPGEFDAISIDVYRPADYVATDFQFNIGETERFYKVVEKNGEYFLDNSCEYVVAAPEGLKTIGNKTLKTEDGSRSIGGSLRQAADGAYYLRTWVYQNFNFKLDTDLKEGWQTLTFSASDIKAKVTSGEVQLFDFSCTGWSNNKNRDWNTEKNSNKLYPDAAKCDIQFKNLVFIKNTDAMATEDDGWNADNTVYVSAATHARVTGVQVIDGVWYEFGADGVLVGKLDGNKTIAVNGADVNVVFEDGAVKYQITDKAVIGADGVAVKDQIVTIGDTMYKVDAEGVLVGSAKAGQSTIVINITDAAGNVTKVEETVDNCTEFTYTFVVNGCDTIYDADGNEIAKEFKIAFVSENVTLDVTIKSNEDPAKHRLDGGVQTEMVSCGTDGQYLYTCQDCGKTFTEIVPMLNAHEYDEGVVTTEPTCGVEGVKTFTCVRCYSTYTEPVAATGLHTYTETPNKSTDTTHYFECTVCGEKKDEVEHTIDTYTMVDDKTHVNGCSICGYTATVEHTIAVEFDETNHWNACTLCEYEAAKVAHNIGLNSNAEGHYDGCDACEYKKEIIPHTPVKIQDRVEPQCTGDGSTEGAKCEVCAYIITPVEPIARLPHTESETWTIDATDHWKVCTVCSTPLDNTKGAHELDMLDLANVDKEAGTATDVCAVCNNAVAVEIDTWYEELGLTKTDDGKYVSDTYKDLLVKFDDGYRYFDANGTLVTDAANVEYDTETAYKGLIVNGKVTDSTGTYAIVDKVMATNVWVTDVANGKEYFYGEDGKLVKPAAGESTITALDVLCNVEPDGAHLIGIVPNGDGTHSYYEDGIAGKRKDAFITSPENKVYYADANGILLKGPQRINDVYYLFGDGVEGELYVLIKQYRNEFVDPVFGDNIFVNAEGMAVTGWILSKGDEYYINEDKTLATGYLVQIGTSIYDFEADGKLIGKHTGWVVVKDGVAKLPEEGDVCNRYIYHGSYIVRDFAKPEGEGDIYYFNADGDKVVSATVIGSGVNYAYALYTFDENGHLVSTSDSNGFGLLGGTPGTYGYFQNADLGLVKNELKEIDGKLYYFDEYGVRVENAAVTVGEVKYWFNENGEGAVVTD